MLYFFCEPTAAIRVEGGGCFAAVEGGRGAGQGRRASGDIARISGAGGRGAARRRHHGVRTAGVDGWLSLGARGEGHFFRGRVGGPSDGDWGVWDAFATVEAGAVAIEGSAAEVAVGSGQGHCRRGAAHAGAEG